MLKLYRSRAHKEIRRPIIKRADAEAIQYRSWARRARRRATTNRADAAAIRIKGPQREEKIDDEESGC